MMSAALGLESDAQTIKMEAPEMLAVKTPEKKKEADDGVSSSCASTGKTSKTLPVQCVKDSEVAAMMKSHKKCALCAEWLEKATQFFRDQAKCKSCYNLTRGLQRLAESQGARRTLDELDMKTHSAVLKQYSKDRDKAKKLGARLKLNINSFLVEFRSRNGLQSLEEGEMMWEGEFYEFCKTPKMGFLTRQESEALWQQYDMDPAVARDCKGPRGYKRLWIKTRDCLNRFAETSQDKAVQRLERLGKEPKAQVLEQRLQLLTDNNAVEGCHCNGGVEVQNVFVATSASCSL